MLAQCSAAAEKAAKAATQNTAAPVEVVRSPIRTLFSRDYRSIRFVNLLLTIGGMMSTSAFQREQRRPRAVHKAFQPHDIW